MTTEKQADYIASLRQQITTKIAQAEPSIFPDEERTIDGRRVLHFAADAPHLAEWITNNLGTDMMAEFAAHKWLRSPWVAYARRHNLTSAIVQADPEAHWAAFANEFASNLTSDLNNLTTQQASDLIDALK